MGAEMTDYVSRLVNRNVKLGTRRTSIRLEPQLWTVLEQIAAAEGMTVHEVVAVAARVHGRGLTNAVRIFMVTYLADRADLLEGKPTTELQPSMQEIGQRAAA